MIRRGGSLLRDGTVAALLAHPLVYKSTVTITTKVGNLLSPSLCHLISGAWCKAYGYHAHLVCKCSFIPNPATAHHYVRNVRNCLKWRPFWPFFHDHLPWAPHRRWAKCLQPWGPAARLRANWLHGQKARCQEGRTQRQKLENSTLKARTGNGGQVVR